jgi:hypothetical protein
MVIGVIRANVPLGLGSHVDANKRGDWRHIMHPHSETRVDLPPVIVNATLENQSETAVIGGKAQG